MLNSSLKAVKGFLNGVAANKGHPLRWAFGMFLAARVLYGLWSLVILEISPLAIQNLMLFGQPIVSVFDLRISRAYLYNRKADEQLLRFFPSGDHLMADMQTGSRWDVGTGAAVSGAARGEKLQEASIATEQIFPYHGVQPYPSPWLALWQRFDANWFLKIAERGYSTNDGSTAFFPLYPLLTRLAGILMGNMFLASLMVSTISLILALILFQNVAGAYTADASSEKRALMYLLVFPSAFFLFSGYTESTYLAFVLSSFWFAKRRSWRIAAFTGAMAALTRGIGILLLPPLLYMWWTQDGQRRWRDALILQLIPFAALSYLGYTRLSTFSSYQRQWHTEFAIPWQHFTEFIALGMRHQLVPVDVFNMLVTLLGGALVFLVWQKLPKELGIYSILMFVAPLFSINTGQPFVSMSRYVLVIFPVFFLLGQWGKNIWINRLILYLSLPAALYFSAQFWLWGWVG